MQPSSGDTKPGIQDPQPGAPQPAPDQPVQDPPVFPDHDSPNEVVFDEEKTAR